MGRVVEGGGLAGTSLTEATVIKLTGRLTFMVRLQVSALLWMHIIEANLHNEKQTDKTTWQVRQEQVCIRFYLPRNINRK